MPSSNLTNKPNWTNMSKPIIGLAPMDGITDSAFREVVDMYGHPDVLFTEFVSVEGLAHGAKTLLKAFQKHKTKTPIVAQLFGCDLKAYKKATEIVCSMNFDGIDINMGCPDRNINKKGGGAALIGRPTLAQDIIKTVKEEVSKHKLKIPVTVKTRIGLDKIVTEDWIGKLLKVRPDAITLHGRTLIQMYKGLANWDEIGKAGKLVKAQNITFLGNGDIKSMVQAREYCNTYTLDGVLIGRAALGNPWLFAEKTPSLKERFKIMVEHSRLYLKYRPDLKLFPMRKHLAWYCTGFKGSHGVRDRLMKVVELKDLETILDEVWMHLH